MVERRDQQPGLIPAPRDWTPLGCGVVLVLALVVLMPWAFISVVMYLLLATP